MFKIERTDKIMNILKKYQYTTVDFLVRELHYSPATVRRDLTYLESLGLVNKSYGGVSINSNAKPVIIREHEQLEEKLRICRKAADSVADDSYIFIDGTTTTYFMKDFLDTKKNISVTTSNLKLATHFGETGIKCYVPGGQIYDTVMLSGTLAADTLKKMSFDTCFFSVGAISADGRLGISEGYVEMLRIVFENSRKIVCLCDSSKLGKHVYISHLSLADVDCIICDKPFEEELKKLYSNTEFLTV